MKYLRGFGFALTTLVLYLGFPLLGWGYGSLGAFFANWARAGYAVVVLVFSLAVGVQAVDAPEGIRGRRGEEDKLVRRQSLVRIGLILVLYAALIFLPLADRRSLAAWGESSALRWLGLVLCVPGYALIFLSGLALGRQYSQEVTIQEDHHLVTTGIFRWIRNPRYLGVILLAFGLSCLFRSWVGLGVSLVVVLVLLLRIKDEEAMLRREFGPAWDSYCQKSWRLIPMIF